MFTIRAIEEALKSNPDPHFHKLIREAYGVTMDTLTAAANQSECSKLSCIKEMVRLFNNVPGYAKLTLTIETKETYTGLEDGVEPD